MIRRSAAAALVALLVGSAAVAGDGDTVLRPWTGQVPAAFTLNDLSGTPHDLANYRGHVVLVHFFATWCAPCRDELAALQRMTRTFDGPPPVVLAVAIDDSAERVRRFISEQPVDSSFCSTTTARWRRHGRSSPCRRPTSSTARSRQGWSPRATPPGRAAR